MAWIERRRRADGGLTARVFWRPGGCRDTPRAWETFGAGSDAQNLARAAVQSRGRHGYYVGSRRGSTFDIAPDQLGCIHHDVGGRVNETNGTGSASDEGIHIAEVRAA
jgi:hypothetical protein